MSKEDGEKWIVNLIRDTRADAKIDFKEVSCAQAFVRRSKRMADALRRTWCT